jgi:hypothetical protein
LHNKHFSKLHNKHFSMGVTKVEVPDSNGFPKLFGRLTR